MVRLTLFAVLLLLPDVGQALVCRAPSLVLRITVEENTCRVGQDVAIRKDTPDAVQCLLSNPQLRIITIRPDGSFSYDDTDNDSYREGVCSAE